MTVISNSTLAVGKVGTMQGDYFTQAANKTVQIASLTINSSMLTVSNANGYGARITGGRSQCSSS